MRVGSDYIEVPPMNLTISRRGVATRRPTIDLFYNESSSDIVSEEIPDKKKIAQLISCEAYQCLTLTLVH